MTNSNIINLSDINNTAKEEPTMKDIRLEGEKFISNGVYANYDAQKVQKVLEAVENTERKAWYETCGVKLDNVTSLETALKLSGLDFEVEKKPLYFGEGDGLTLIDKQFATVRTDTNQFFGVVSDSYQILQNREAFDFLDSLVLEGAKFETAGFFRKNGAASYITMSAEPMNILGDNFDNYFMISNGHDGSSAVKVAITPIRSYCRNSAILALKKATNVVSIQHSKTMADRLVAAKEILTANSNYLNELKIVAEELAVKPFSAEAFEALARKLYPVKEDASEIVQIRNLAQIEKLMKAYKEDDLQNFNGTAWKVIQAVSDMESHPTQIRKTTKVSNNGTPEFQVIYNGMPLLNKVFQMVMEAV